MRNSIFFDIIKGLSMTNFVLRGMVNTRSFDRLSNEQYEEIMNLNKEVMNKIKMLKR